MKCKDRNYDCARRGEGETECFYEIEMRKQKEAKEAPYWKHFRAEAAKDILCALIHKTDNFIGKDSAGYAIMIADELIKQLKEKEVK